MEKFSIADVVRAFEVLRMLRDVNGVPVPEGEPDPLYPNWVQALEGTLDELTRVYFDTARLDNENFLKINE